MVQRKTASDWTGEHVKRFWDWLGRSPHLRDDYFSVQVGEGVTHFLELTGRLKGKLLDYGCGPGHLLERLIRRPVDCYGAEFSPEAVGQLNARFEGNPRWKGARLVTGLPTPWDDRSFDVVLCTETIEHLTDEFLVPVVDEIRRLTRPGGTAMFTTPFAENLERAMIYCPFCDSEFHRVQHVRSFTVESLRTLLESRGFEVLFCKNVNLFEFQRPMRFPGFKDWGTRSFYNWFGDMKSLAAGRLAPRQFPGNAEFVRRAAVPGPNLCAVASPRA